MTFRETVNYIIILFEDYYGAKYRPSVRAELVDYLMSKSQNWVVALSEMVKLKESTRYKTPPCKAVFEEIGNKFYNDIMINLEKGNIVLKSLLAPECLKISDKEMISENDKKIVADKLLQLKNKLLNKS